MYTSDFFYSHRDSYHISQVMVDQIKSLEAHHSNESGYYDNMLQWRLEDNPQVTAGELNNLYPAMQFISMSAKIKTEFIKKYNVQDWQISLLRRLYLDWDDDESELITMGFKRPFGNSNVLDDVREEMVRYGIKSAIERDQVDEDNHTPEQEALNQFVDMLEKFYQEGFELKVNSFSRKYWIDSKAGTRINFDDWIGYIDENLRLHSYLREWSPDISAIREEKINNLLTT